MNIDTGVVSSSWRTPYLFNYPMALSPSDARLAIVFRLPARLVLFDRSDGRVLATAPTCGDSDDVYFDAPGRLIYVACGGGSVDVFDVNNSALRHAGNIPTAPGARTALYVPALDRLFVAARAQQGMGAAILVFRPAP